MHPLEELSGLVSPKDARHPVAQQAIIRVTQRLRHIVKSDRWPKPHQITGVAFCELARDRALVCDDMGLGKTSIAILRILAALHLPAVIVCPPSVLLNWKREIELWNTNVPIHRLDKQARPVPHRGWVGIVLTTWDLLTYHLESLIALQPRILVADEAHYALNNEAGRSVALDQIADACPHVLLMTGTPQKNRPQDLWRLLNILDRQAWSEITLPAFKELAKDDFSAALQSRLGKRIRQYMLRRTKDIALRDELTAKQIRPFLIHIPEERMATYRQVERRFEEWLNAKVRSEIAEEGLEFTSEGDLGAEITRRSRKALSSKSLAQVGRLREIVGALKAPYVARWALDAARVHEPVVVFAHHQQVIEIISRELRNHGVKHGLIVGKTPKTRRFSLVNEFQGGKIDVLLCSGAAREGLTLTRARHVMQGERFWTPAEEDQAADRLHRIGQKRDVMVWRAIAVGTYDERMDQVNVRKRVLIRRTVEGEKS